MTCVIFCLSVPVKYTHYGEIYKNVDMRAEVGLMTRHIHIRGEVSDGKSNGGHVKVKVLNIEQYNWAGLWENPLMEKLHIFRQVQKFVLNSWTIPH